MIAFIIEQIIMPKRSLLNFFCLSLLLHGLFLSYLSFYFFTVSAVKGLPKPYLNTYMHVDELAHASAKTLIEKDEAIVLKKHDKPIQPRREVPKQKPHDTVFTNYPIAASEQDAQHERAILKLLHEAIAKAQTYPETALLLKQKGTVKIGFVLFPDGRLQNITLLKSSGFDEIDSAALAAVNNISPVKAIGTLLKKSELFSIDIVFQ